MTHAKQEAPEAVGRHGGQIAIECDHKSTATAPTTSSKRFRKGGGKTGRVNRTAAETDALRHSLIDIVLRRGRQVTPRNVYYLALGAGLGEKSDKFSKLVSKLLDTARRTGELDWHWIMDETRGPRIMQTYQSVPQALQSLADEYRLSYWDIAPHNVMIWSEKRTQNPTMNEVTDRYNVYYNCTNGANSTSNGHDAAMYIEDKGKPTFIFYFGDLDKPGLDIYNAFRRDILAWTPNVDVVIERAGVTFEQVEKFALLSHDANPTHKADWRKHCQANGWPLDQVWELDAFEAEDLQGIVESCILRHIDPDEYEGMLKREAREKKSLLDFAATYEGGTP